MRTILWTLLALLGHWRRHPGGLATLLAGLAIATALWSGVQALNAQARRSYDDAAAIFSDGGAISLVPARGGLLAQALFPELRRAGVKVSPVIEGTVRIGDHSVRLIGIEPLTLPRAGTLASLADARTAMDVISGDGRAFATRETLETLGLKPGARPNAARGHALPSLDLLSGAPPGAIIMDIGAAQKALERPSRLSRLLLATAPDAALSARLAALGLRIVAPEEDNDLARLTDSFHLNLTAFGLLAFLVGFFIVNAAFGLAFEQRLPMLRTLRALGVSARALIAALLVELALFTLVAGGAGVLGGYLIAAALLPNVAASLEGLYGAHVSGVLTLDLRWLLSGLGMAGGGALFAAGTGLVKTLRLPTLGVARPIAWREAHQRYLARQAGLALAALAGAAVAAQVATGLAGGFATIAGALLGVALALPLALALLLQLGERLAQRPLSRWFFADGRQEIAGLSLALMALLLALATNIGVGGMVEGFRQTFVAWLDQRLVAEVYYEAATPADAREIEAWARAQPDVSAILPVWRAKTRIGGWPVDIMGMTPHETYTAHFPLGDVAPDVWSRLHTSDAALVSEQLARRLGLAPGDGLDIPTSGEVWRVSVAGIFPDYGNPKGQLRIDHARLVAHFDDASGVHYSLRVAPGMTAQVMTALQARFGDKIARIVDQAEVRKLSTDIFERTFAVTTALNALTLGISAVALFTSLLTLSNMRLARIAPVWAIGVTRRRLAGLELLRILLFAGGAALLAIPLGVFVTWGLVAVVNVAAFGWRLPMYVFPMDWLLVFMIALATAAIAGAAPVVRLARSAPVDLLRAFADER